MNFDWRAGIFLSHCRNVANGQPIQGTNGGRAVMGGSSDLPILWFVPRSPKPRRHHPCHRCDGGKRTKWFSTPTIGDTNYLTVDG